MHTPSSHASRVRIRILLLFRLTLTTCRASWGAYPCAMRHFRRIASFPPRWARPLRAHFSCFEIRPRWARAVLSLFCMFWPQRAHLGLSGLSGFNNTLTTASEGENHARYGNHGVSVSVTASYVDLCLNVEPDLNVFCEYASIFMFSVEQQEHVKVATLRVTKCSKCVCGTHKASPTNPLH